MASTIKVNNIQNQCGANIVNKCSTTITLGASGDNITLACGATQSGFGRTGTVNWDTTAKTAGFTAVSGTGYFVNTTSGAITATLPAGSAGAIVAFADYANTFDTNNLTIAPNGTDKIGGVNGNAIVSTEGASTTFVYVDSTQGWKQVNDATLNTIGTTYITATGGTVTCCGDYKIHTFTGPGTFTVCSVGNNPANNVVDYLVVAGGAAGGNGRFNISCCGAGGGGGAGGFRESSGVATGCYTASPLGACVSALPITATAYPITVGGGGSGVFAQPGGCGTNSVFSTITSAGGGGGGAGGTAPESQPGKNGGSGGGAGGRGAKPGGTGNTPPVAPPQGNNGGSSIPGDVGLGAGGGGGATVAGSNGAPSVGGAGGAGAGTGINSSCTVGTPGPSPSLRYFSGGGGGTSQSTQGTGGVGGGTAGVYGGVSNNSPNNSGGGAGGSGATPAAGGNGGSGIVIIRYKYQ